MTPIMCFRVKNLEIWIQDYSGQRTHVATCPTEGQHIWLVNSLVVYHGKQAYEWDIPDSRVH